MFCITSASFLYQKHKHIDNVTQIHYATFLRKARRKLELMKYSKTFCFNFQFSVR